MFMSTLPAFYEYNSTEGGGNALVATTTEPNARSGSDGDYFEHIFRHHLGWTVVFICAFITIFVVGTIGNLMVVVLVSRPHMKSVTNIFIRNLAVADLLVITFCGVPTLLRHILIPWVLGPLMCKAVTYVQGVSVCASAYSLAAISLDRLLAIFYPSTVRRTLSKTQAVVILLAIWIASFAILSPWIMVFSLAEKNGFVSCIQSWASPFEDKLYFILGQLVLCYALPLCLVILGNGLIWRHLVNRKAPQESASLATITRVHDRTRHKVLRRLTIVTLTFGLSWQPLYVIFLICKIWDSLSTAVESMIPFAQLLGISNSALNPIIYALLNDKFRDAFTSMRTP